VRRPSPTGPGWEVLVKWEGLGYEHASWEVSWGVEKVNHTRMDEEKS
jgi:hypothetical protein